MLHQAWEKEYELILKRGLDSGEIDVKGQGAEQRNSPRFKVTTGEIWLKVDHTFEVIDVSLTGISFFSSHSFMVGQDFAFTLGKAFLVEAQVVSVHKADNGNQGHSEEMIRVACTFNQEHTGLRLLVMMLELGETQVETSSVG